MDEISIAIIIAIIFIITIVIAILIPRIIPIYNEFISLSNSAEAELSQIRVAMKRRLDSIQQLFDLLSSYAHFENKTQMRITQMRTSVLNANLNQLNGLDKSSQGFLLKLITVAENYPNLKTSDVVQSLITNVTDIEREITDRRYQYNEIVKNYNILKNRIPSNILAILLGFKKMDYLTFDDSVSIPQKLMF